MKIPWLDSLPAKKRRRVLWTAGLLLFYTVFGFLLLPLIVRAVAVKQLSKLLDRPVSIAKVKFNPYTLSATVRGLLVQDKDGQPLLSWDEVYVNFQLSSFLGRAWVLKEVRSTRPFVRVQINKDYSLNVSDLIEKFSVSATNTPTQPSQPLALRVGSFQIIGASVSLTDLSPRTNVASRLTSAVAVVTRVERGAASGDKGATALLRGSGEAAPSRPDQGPPPSDAAPTRFGRHPMRLVSHPMDRARRPTRLGRHNIQCGRRPTHLGRHPIHFGSHPICLGRHPTGFWR